MKRVFQLMIATASTSVFVSCGDGTDSTHTESTIDSAAVATPTTPAVDSAAMQMDTTNMGTNTDSTAVDSTVAVTDKAS